MDSIIKLPGGFRHDGKLIREVELRELSGIEEDILTSKTQGADAKTQTQRMTEIFARCTVRIGDKIVPNNSDPSKAAPTQFQGYWSSAFAGDRGYAAIQLRRLSLGDKYRFEEQCPHCKTEIKGLSSDLGTLDVDPYFRNLRQYDPSNEEISEADAAALKEEDEARVAQALLKPTHQETLPGGTVITYRLFTAEDEDNIIALQKEDADSILTHLLRFRITEINGQPASARSIKLLSFRDRRWLFNFFDKVEGGVNTTITVECPRVKCGATFSKKLDVGQKSFFFPSEI